MSVFTTAAILVTLAALFSYINYRFLKIPTTIGIMLISLVMSLGLIGLHMLGWSSLEEQAEQMVRGIDFHEALMEGMLSFLLFAGALFGLVLGLSGFFLLRSIDNYQVEILITLALVMGGYSAASALHLSGPIAMVVAGLVIGNHGRWFAMSETTRERLDNFWELVDEVLNAVLFVLIGLEILLLSISQQYVLAGVACIPAVLLARFISVGVPITLLRSFRTFSPKVIRILTWSGLRGGISVALALSLPAGAERDVILTITYAVVVFSILVQGLTVAPLVASIRK